MLVTCVPWGRDREFRIGDTFLGMYYWAGWPRTATQDSATGGRLWV